MFLYDNGLRHERVNVDSKHELARVSIIVNLVQIVAIKFKKLLEVYYYYERLFHHQNIRKWMVSYSFSFFMVFGFQLESLFH